MAEKPFQLMVSSDLNLTSRLCPEETISAGICENIKIKIYNPNDDDANVPYLKQDIAILEMLHVCCIKILISFAVNDQAVIFKRLHVFSNQIKLITSLYIHVRVN